MTLFDNAEQMVQEADRFAQQLVNQDVKAHQLRRIYDTVQGIESSIKKIGELDEDQKNRLIFLKPLLAYLASKNSELSALQIRLSQLIERIQYERQLEEFFMFLQSIMAYHKYHSGKDKTH